MNARTCLLLAGIAAGTGVAIGAFGAHALPGMLAPLELGADVLDRRINSFETGVRYQLYHALALLGVGLLMELRSPARLLQAAACLFVTGTVLFSGLLYLYALTGNKTTVMIVPLGGIAFILGWIVFSRSAFRGGSN